MEHTLGTNIVTGVAVAVFSYTSLVICFSQLFIIIVHTVQVLNRLYSCVLCAMKVIS